MSARVARNARRRSEATKRFPTRRHLGELTDAITTLEAALGGKANTPLERAQVAQRITDARRFQSALGSRVRELEGSNERLKQAMRQKYAAY